jgi:hypothetical protein
MYVYICVYLRFTTSIKPFSLFNYIIYMYVYVYVCVCVCMCICMCMCMYMCMYVYVCVCVLTVHDVYEAFQLVQRAVGAVLAVMGSHSYAIEIGEYGNRGIGE